MKEVCNARRNIPDLKINLLFLLLLYDILSAFIYRSYTYIIRVLYLDLPKCVPLWLQAVSSRKYPSKTGFLSTFNFSKSTSNANLRAYSLGSIITVFQHRTKRQLELISSSVFLQSFFFLSFFFALFLVLVSSSSQKNFIHIPRFIRFIKAFPMGPHNHFYSFFFLYSFPFFHVLSLITVFLSFVYFNAFLSPKAFLLIQRLCMLMIYFATRVFHQLGQSKNFECLITLCRISFKKG